MVALRFGHEKHKKERLDVRAEGELINLPRDDTSVPADNRRSDNRCTRTSEINVHRFRKAAN